MKTHSLPRQQSSFGRKRAKQCGVVRLQGIGSFCGRGNVVRGKIIPAQVLPVLQGKGPERKRSISAGLIFGYFVSRQSNSHPSANERADAVASTK
ncbi:MAG TPA: hypothetical protein VIM77_14945 [Mucilaginibacter sp.]